MLQSCFSASSPSIPVEIPKSLLSRMKIPKELRIEARYRTIFEVLGRTVSLSDSIGSIKPNIGD